MPSENSWVPGMYSRILVPKNKSAKEPKIKIAAQRKKHPDRIVITRINFDVFFGTLLMFGSHMVMALPSVVGLDFSMNERAAIG